MSKRPSVLSEDSQMLYNKWVSGIAKRDLQPDIITIADIVNRYRNSHDGPRPFPYPLAFIIDFLGNIYVQCADFRKQLLASLANPVIKDRKESIEAVRDLNKKIDMIQKLVFTCTEDLNKIVEK